MIHILLLPLLCAAPALADFLGPHYPQPTDLSSDKSTIPRAWKEITSTLSQHLDGSSNKTFAGLPGLDNVTFSIGMFSLNDPDACDLQFHYTAPEVKNAVNGTHEVDGDSIYRVASVTKVFTVLTGLLQLNDTDWDLAVSDVFPEVLQLAEKPASENAVNTLQWDRITLRTLASQISGLPTNPLGGDLLVAYLQAGTDPTSMGYPPYNPKIVESVCTDYSNVTCFLSELAPREPNFLPWASPVYSNNNFLLLTGLIENITGQPLPTLMQKSILQPLDLPSTFPGPVDPANFNRSVIIDLANFQPPTGFGLTAGSGGIASSTNDLATFGKALLNSTLLPAEKTRQWMKPTSHTARSEFSFGMPWEILRFTHASGAMTDLYTKAGESGYAYTYLVLIPDYNAGFSILSSSSHETANALIAALGDLVSNTLLPALEAQAAAEAASNFAGRYASPLPNLNSSLVLAVNSTPTAAPGLLITEFISNGTDIFAQEVMPVYFTPGARLVPSIAAPGVGLSAFRVATAGDAPSVGIGRTLFSGNVVANQLIGDAVSYAGVSVSLFVFGVDGEGRAGRVSPAAWDVELQRMGEGEGEGRE